MPKEQLITISLPSLVDMVLSHGYWECRPIPPDVAEMVFILTKNQHTCYVEFNDEHSKHLSEPLLWDFAHWQTVHDHRARTKARAKKNHEEWELLKANTKLVGKAFAIYSGCDIEQAEQVANKLLREGGRKIKAFYDGQLYTRLEEIP